MRFEEGLTLEQVSQVAGLGNAQRADRRIKEILARLDDTNVQASLGLADALKRETEAAERLADRVADCDGHVEPPAHEFFDNPKSERTKDFLSKILGH